MPLPKRVVLPMHVARGTLPDDYPLPSELEGVTNGTLANTVRQLSSLSRHAEDLFGELARDAQEIYDRSNSLQARIDRLAIKVTQLDSTGEEVSLQDIHMRKAFKSAIHFDQHIFSRSTMPTALLEMYKSCDRPPPLDKLNSYREDGKDGLKFYTDPNYFFELWREEVLKDTERVMHDRGKKPHRPRPESGQGGGRHKKRVRQPVNTKERQKERAIGHGEYIMPSNVQYGQLPLQEKKMDVNNQWEPQKPSRPISIDVQKSYPQPEVDGPIYLHQQYIVEATNPYQAGMYQQGNPDSPGPLGTPTKVNKIRPSQPPPAPPSNPQTPQSNTPTRSRSMSSKDLPPPPPPPEGAISPPNGLPPHISRQSSQSRSNSPHSHQATPEPDLPPPPPVPKQASPPKQATPIAPPPPPPPPMPSVLNGPPQITNGDIAKLISSAPIKLTPVKDRQVKLLPAPEGTRNDLLKAIRDGIKLRKVEKIEQKEVERGNGLHDVASILARRVAVELSESESDSDSDCDSSDGWGENETSA